MARHPSPHKARKILRDDSAQGKPLTKAQKGFFGVIAGGKTPRSVKGLERAR